MTITMKKISIILICVLVALASCTKSKEVHPELGDGNDEIVTVGMKDVHVEYTRTDHAELSRVVFHYSLAEAQQFAAAEMMKQETFFELTLNDLLSDTLYDYYYELFYNGGETSITTRKTFHTQAFETPTPPTPPSGVPEGAINGLFSVSPTQKVYFSQGNLQYQASTNTWRFAENQLSYVGGVDYWTGNEWGNVYENGIKCDNTLASSTYNGWMDLFGWGTSGYHDNNDPYNIHFEPWETTDYTVSPEYNFVGYGPSLDMPSSDLTGLSENYDWGIYNAIINGGNETHLWRTLSMDEWSYILNSRNTTSGARYVKATVAGYEGIILLPDDWNNSYYDLYNINSGTSSFGSNEIILTTWKGVFEQVGAVFLLEAGVRGYDVNMGGVIYRRPESAQGAAPLSYWTTTHYDSANAHCLYVHDNSFIFGICLRTDGRSVRLVQDANP